jgi:hypothetical protein
MDGHTKGWMDRWIVRLAQILRIMRMSVMKDRNIHVLKVMQTLHPSFLSAQDHRPTQDCCNSRTRRLDIDHHLTRCK